jgi:hypothetical protein
MGYHDEIPFEGLHKAKFMGGLDADLPLTPEGFGDAYWAVDVNKVYLTNAAGDTWVEFVPTVSGGVESLDDLDDVSVASAVTGDGLVFNGTEWQGQNVPRVFGTGTVLFDPTGVIDGKIFVYSASLSRFVMTDRVVNLADLGDVGTFTAAKGDIIVNNGSLFTNLTVGVNGQMIAANSGTATGLEWQTPFTANAILTADFEVLVDSDGNVLTI